jgi:hypothetical protein
MVPVLQGTDDYQHLLIMDLIVTFHSIETLGIVGDRMPHVFCWGLL